MTDPLAVTLEQLRPYLQHRPRCFRGQRWGAPCDCGLDQLAVALAERQKKEQDGVADTERSASVKKRLSALNQAILNLPTYQEHDVVRLSSMTEYYLAEQVQELIATDTMKALADPGRPPQEKS